MIANAPVYSLVYSSTAAEPFSDADLAALLAKSRENNEHANITGMLLYRGGQFIQFLEGPERAVRDLLVHIVTDPRHADLHVLIEGRTPSRQFADWTMGYEPVVEPTDALPNGFRDTFEDLDQANDPSIVLRATQQLSLWFRVRNKRVSDRHAGGLSSRRATGPMV